MPKHFPTQVVILRHAEKPAPLGDGSEPDPHLSDRGRSRASALSRTIPGSPLSPDFLFATALSVHSNRPVETITPLSQVMKLGINSKHADIDYATVAAAILNHDQYQNKSVLVCWHHGKIPQLAGALGVQNAPAPWPSAVFDRFWVVTFPNGMAQLRNLPQHVLPGDSPS